MYLKKKNKTKTKKKQQFYALHVCAKKYNCAFVGQVWIEFAPVQGHCLHLLCVPKIPRLDWCAYSPWIFIQEILLEKMLKGKGEKVYHLHNRSDKCFLSIQLCEKMMAQCTDQPLTCSERVDLWHTCLPLVTLVYCISIWLNTYIIRCWKLSWG